MAREKDILDELCQKVIEGEIEETYLLAQEVLEMGLDPLKAIDEGLIPGIVEVGRRYDVGEYYLPELMMAAEAMKRGLEPLEERISEMGVQRQTLGVVVIGTVKGDLHDIGKSIVATMLSANGFTVHDLGVDVSPDRFLAQVEETGADILAMSALLPTTMLYMETVIQEAQKRGLRDRIKIMVGGAPVTAAFAQRIRADGYGDNAFDAVRLARQFMGIQ